MYASYLLTAALTALQFSFAMGKSVNLSDGTTYSYNYVTASESKPTLLLLHGFPSSSQDWNKIIPGLTDAGYGIIAPDLLGYGSTDIPEDVESYSFKRMSDHVAEIVTLEGLSQVVGVGHDWGAGFLGMLWVAHPDLFSKLVFTGLGYSAPGIFDLDTFLAQTEQAYGRPTFGYWKFFNEDDAGATLDQHVPSLVSLAYPANPADWTTTVGPEGATKAFVTADKMGPLPSWMTQEEFDGHVQLLSAGGLTGPTNWYKSRIRNVDAAWYKTLTDAQKQITVPVELIAATNDPVGGDSVPVASTKPYVADLTVDKLPTGHWVQLELPDEMVAIIKKFVG